MRNQSWIRVLTLTALLVPAAMLPAQEADKTDKKDKAARTAQTAGDENTARKPDNTRNNKADREAGGTTADQARNNRTDVQLMQQIRKAITKDKALSTYAHNVKVVAENGKVTLKGPVRSDEERRAIETKAIAVAGAENVTNNITVKDAAASQKP